MLNNGRYRLVRELGSGGFGSVHLAVDTHSGRKVAIKFLIFDTPETRARFEREGRVLYRQINNRFVIDLLDYEFHHDPPYLVLEYCEQGSLRSWVAKRRPWRQVALALSHAVQGLHEIHSAGGFHRDLKPDNLLVGRDAETGTLVVKVADFGLARMPVTIRGSMTRSPAGTEGYIAPEVLAGRKFSARADMYSLGVVAAELLMGTRNPTALARAKCPAEMRQLVRALLAGDPAQRPDAHRMARTLKRLLAAPTPRPAQVVAPSSGGAGKLVLGGLLFGGALLALNALAGGGAKSWDENVGRYRGPDGRFRKG